MNAPLSAATIAPVGSDDAEEQALRVQLEFDALARVIERKDPSYRQ